MYLQFAFGKHTAEGKLYNNMISRVRLGNSSDYYKNYRGISVSKNFKDFQFFADWCNKQVGFNSKDDYGRNFNLDKDLLKIGNKEYNENFCVFVPSEINSFLLKGGNHDKDNGLPIGVSYREDRGYTTYVSIPWRKKQKRHGPYKTLEKAMAKYEQTKLEVALYLAEKYKDQIDVRAYEAILNFNIKERGYNLGITC